MIPWYWEKVNAGREKAGEKDSSPAKALSC